MSPELPLPLAGRVAVVTGSASGIGRAIALELADAGADVLVHARQNHDGAKQTLDEIQLAGRESHMIMADLTETALQDRLAHDAWDWRGQVDIWVNNAGVDTLTGAAAGWSFEDKLAALWQVDVIATMRLTRAIGQRMVDRGRGVIMNIGWDGAEHGMAGDSGELFAAVKGAVMAFTRSAARSLAPQVRVNCIAPGWIKTSWGENASEYWQQRAKSESLMERWGLPDDVAKVAVFLASDAASFVSGQVIAVNGGRS